MGFNSTHLEAKTKLSNDQKGQLIGNSLATVMVARLLPGLVITEDEEVKRLDLTGLLWQKLA